MNDKDYLIETMTTALAKRVLDEGRATDIQSALDTVFNSDIYEKMCDERTGLMYQNPGYVYGLFEDATRLSLS